MIFFRNCKKYNVLILLTLIILQLSCSKKQINQLDTENAIHFDHSQDDAESIPDMFKVEISSCAHANGKQLAQVNNGASKLNQFLTKCYSETGSKKWCDQVARPNPDSRATFDCTYSPEQPHVFIHPDEKTWRYSIEAVKLVQELLLIGIKVDIIYNWWRPEPYNANVGGAAGRHPFGTSVDVRFVNKAEQNRAHSQLCKWRSQGRLRALGYYPGTGLHFGMGDTAANTWGRACP